MISQMNIGDKMYIIAFGEVAAGEVAETGFDTTGEFVKLGKYGSKYYLKDTLGKVLFTGEEKARAVLENRTCQECIHLPICKAYTKKHPETTWKDECALVCPEYKDHKKYLYLPFTVGDTVYIITKSPVSGCGREILKCTVASMRILNDTNDISYSCEGNYLNGTWYQGNFRTSSIGKKVFLHEADAQEVLSKG